MTALPRRTRLSHALLVGTLLLAGAHETCAQAAPAAPTARDTTAAAVVQAYVRAYNAHDVDAVLSFLAPVFVWLSASGDSLTVEARGPPWCASNSRATSASSRPRVRNSKRSRFLDHGSPRPSERTGRARQDLGLRPLLPCTRCAVASFSECGTIRRCARPGVWPTRITLVGAAGRLR